MPELPEVETIKNDLMIKILNKEIKLVKIKLKKIIKSDRSQFIKVLKGNNFNKINRRGKLLFFTLARGHKYLLVHLKMTGQLIYQKGEKIVAGGHSIPKMQMKLPNKYSHVIFIFSDNSKLFFNDIRQFGYMKIVKIKELKEILEKFGMEPMSGLLNVDYLVDIFKNRKISIKAVLLDQSKIAGIGNIYADEILFASGIKPDRITCGLKKSEIEKILKAIKNIIPKAIKYRGTTFNDYLDANGNKGNFLSFLKVYQKEEQKCRKCKKGIVKKTKIAGRGTRYCPGCQK